jgi:prepilin-type processing-associated H-X9-DG protein
MRLSTHRPTAHGLTRLDVAIVIAVLGTLGLFVGSALNAARRMAKGIHCVNNLKNVGLDFSVFATDHDDHFPWQVPAKDGGTADLFGQPESLWRHFLVVTNAQMRPNNLDYPRYLWCPMDSSKRPAATFFANPANPRAAVFSGNQHVSYFLNLGASTNELQAETPDRILSGDRNLLVDGKAIGPGTTLLSGGLSVGFTARRIHRGYGQLLFADGSVWQGISNRVAGAANATNLLLIP